VSSEAFEPFEEAPQPAAVAAAAWKCLVCNYVHPGVAPPEICPVCGAPADRFEPTAAARAPVKATAPQRVVIVGAGIAGLSAAESARQAAPDAEILLLSKESSGPYYRLNLTRFLAGEITNEALPLHDSAWYADQGIDVRLGEVAAELQLRDRLVRLGSGQSVGYDRLILTAGSHPFVPPIMGAQREGVTSLRTLADAEAILARAAKGGRCVVLGGGLLGLETAGALARRGLEVTVLEGFGWLLPRQLDQRAGEMLADRVAEQNITLRMAVKAKEIVGDECVRGVELADGAVVEADVLVMATGVRPNSYLARQAGLDVRGGIVVDNHLRCSAPDVYAAGDIAEHQGVLYGTWGPAQFQGSIAGLNAIGGHTEFGGIPRSNTLKVLDIDLFSIGEVAPTDGSFDVSSHQSDAGHYYRFLFRDGVMVGAILLGDTGLTATVNRLVDGKQDMSKILRSQPSGAELYQALLES
jgi:nitrite reductase (NADH) large subunit